MTKKCNELLFIPYHDTKFTTIWIVEFRVFKSNRPTISVEVEQTYNFISNYTSFRVFRGKFSKELLWIDNIFTSNYPWKHLIYVRVNEILMYFVNLYIYVNISIYITMHSSLTDAIVLDGIIPEM